jgi:hypothetical protein
MCVNKWLNSMLTISFTIAGKDFMLTLEQYVLRVDAGARWWIVLCIICAWSVFW